MPHDVAAPFEIVEHEPGLRIIFQPSNGIHRKKFWIQKKILSNPPGDQQGKIDQYDGDGPEGPSQLFLDPRDRRGDLPLKYGVGGFYGRTSQDKRGHDTVKMDVAPGGHGEGRESGNEER